MVFATSSVATVEPLLTCVESIGDSNISSPAHMEGDDKRLMLRSQESEQSCEPVNRGQPRSGVGLLGKVLRLASFLNLKSFRGPFSLLLMSLTLLHTSLRDIALFP
jgi:hypothetical protein